MDIKGLDYNTQRPTLQLPEYGREIQKMVDLAVTLPTREERLRCAKTIVKMMLTRVPQIRENADYKQTLWDHLYLMSGRALDIDWPYDVSQAEKIHTRPEPLRHPQTAIHMRHYGRLVEETFDILRRMPEGPERDELARLTAYQMKRDLVMWGHGSTDDERVLADLAYFTDGAIQLDPRQIRLSQYTPVVEQQPKRQGKKKK